MNKIMAEQERIELGLLQARSVLKNLDAEQPGCGYAKLAAICETAALGEYLDVPSLAWTTTLHKNGESEWHADTGFHSLYRVREDDQGFYVSLAGTPIGNVFSSPDDAKEFCQTDYLLRASNAFDLKIASRQSSDKSDQVFTVTPKGP